MRCHSERSEESRPGLLGAVCPTQNKIPRLPLRKSTPCTSFPRKRESIFVQANMDPRFRRGDVGGGLIRRAGAATRSEARLARMHVPSHPSRLFVPLSGLALGLASPDFVFAKRGVLCSFRGQIARHLCTKRASFAAFKKVMCFVFSNILALFPVFLNSLAVPQVSPSRAI